MNHILSYFKSNKLPEIIEKDLYIYKPQIFHEIKYNDIFDEIKEYLIQNGSLKSCICIDKNLTDDKQIFMSVPCINWTNIIYYLKVDIEQMIEDTFDYALIHLYQDGTSSMNWQSDKIELNNNVVKISFGTARTFCIRESKNPKNQKKYILQHGDIFIMKPGFHNKYQYCINTEYKIHEPKISITFRKFGHINLS